MAWFIPLLVSLAFSVLSYLISPKPKAQKPPETKDADDPVAEAGMPIPVVFGTITVKGLNILWYGDKSKTDYEIKA